MLSLHEKSGGSILRRQEAKAGSIPHCVGGRLAHAPGSSRIAMAARPAFVPRQEAGEGAGRVWPSVPGSQDRFDAAWFSMSGSRPGQRHLILLFCGSMTSTHRVKLANEHYYVNLITQVW